MVCFVYLLMSKHTSVPPKVYQYILLMFLSIAVAVNVHGQERPTHNMQAEDAFGEGIRHQMAERLDKAASSFKKASEYDPNNAAIRYKLAEVLYKQNKLPEAVSEAELALKYDNNNPYYYLLLSEIQQKIGKRKDAIKNLKALVKKFPNEPEYYYNLAEAHFNEKEVNESIKVLDQLEKKVGRNEELTRQKQQVLLTINKLDEAIKEGEALIKMAPDEVRYMLAQAELLINNGKLDEAYKWLSKVKELQPDNGYASLLMYEIYKAQKKTSEAQKEFDLAIGNPEVNIDDKVNMIRPYLESFQDTSRLIEGLKYAAVMKEVHPLESKAFALYGDFNNLLGRNKAARSAYLESTRLPNSTLAVWQEIVRIDTELGDIDSCIKHTTAATELYPNQALFWFYKGRSHYFKKEYAPAAEALVQTAKLANGNTELIVQSYGMAGDAYHFLKDHISSDDAYEKVLKTDPNNEHVLNNYAYFLSLRKEKLAYARELCQRLISKAPNNATYLDTYGWVLYQLKDYKEAYIMIEKAIAAGSASGVVYEHFGDALWKAGEKPRALEAWKKALSLGGDVTPLLQKKVSQQAYVD